MKFSPLRGFALAGLAMICAAAPLAAQEIRGTAHVLGQQRVTIYVHDFLSAEERATLQVVAGNEQALALFVTTPGRYSAMAVAPDEGFIRNGQPVASAVALSDLESVEEAREAVLKGCNKARKGGKTCLLVLEVAPAR